MTIAVIQFSGNTLEDVLTLRAYNTFKALYALAALDRPGSSNEPRENEIPTCSEPTFSVNGNDCIYLSNHSILLLNSSLAVPRNGRIHISISIDYVILLSWTRLAAVSLLLPQLCKKI